MVTVEKSFTRRLSFLELEAVDPLALCGLRPLSAGQLVTLAVTVFRVLNRLSGVRDLRSGRKIGIGRPALNSASSDQLAVSRSTASAGALKSDGQGCPRAKHRAPVRKRYSCSGTCTRACPSISHYTGQRLRLAFCTACGETPSRSAPCLSLLRSRLVHANLALSAPMGSSRASTADQMAAATASSVLSASTTTQRQGSAAAMLRNARRRVW